MLELGIQTIIKTFNRLQKSCVSISDHSSMTTIMIYIFSLWRWLTSYFRPWKPTTGRVFPGYSIPIKTIIPASAHWTHLWRFILSTKNRIDLTLFMRLQLKGGGVHLHVTWVYKTKLMFIFFIFYRIFFLLLLFVVVVVVVFIIEYFFCFF